MRCRESATCRPATGHADVETERQKLKTPQPTLTLASPGASPAVAVADGLNVSGTPFGAGIHPIWSSRRSTWSRLYSTNRITCIFVDKRYRKHGYAKVALAGALDQIAAQGGGVVEGYPHEIGEKRMSNSFVYNGTRTMYEQADFEFVRSKGLKNTVMRRTIRPA